MHALCSLCYHAATSFAMIVLLPLKWVCQPCEEVVLKEPTIQIRLLRSECKCWRTLKWIRSYEVCATMWLQPSQPHCSSSILCPSSSMPTCINYTHILALSAVDKHMVHTHNVTYRSVCQIVITFLRPSNNILVAVGNLITCE